MNIDNKRINKEEFELLVSLVQGKDVINEKHEKLIEKGYVNKNGITELGLTLLEPYKVKRVVIIAAGFGVRLVPITINTPKPLVRVNGVRIIDTLLDAISQAGIEEIYIVRGYLKEQFDQLLEKYPNIKFIDNLSYNEANNISSILKAGDIISNSYVMEADLLLKNKKLVRKYEYSSNFLGFKVEQSEDWCFTVKDGIITDQVVGANAKDYKGFDIYQEIGISYWDNGDGKKIAKDIIDAFNLPNGKNLYWDQLMFKIFPERYQVELRECQKDDVLEIDTFKELQAVDSAYKV